MTINFEDWFDWYREEDDLIDDNGLSDADYAGDDDIVIYGITDALTVLGAGYWGTRLRHQATEMVADAVNIALGDEYDVDVQELYDWVYEGSYTGPETIKSLAQEWRMLEAYWAANQADNDEE